MPKKKTAKAAPQDVELPEVTPLALGQTYATSEAVTAEQAMEKIAAGWVLTQNDNDLIVVACPSEIYEA
tara:strand:- start:639 stop:845 length:207 start_codon:yes stop_codon:yes gene_type:complete